ncbi:hypothetical protein J7L68_02080 [bacterium]|nr:hypothetical protein [bacterium]
MDNKKSDNEKIEKNIRSKFSGFFMRGNLSGHDAKIVEKWIKKFVELHEIQGEQNAGS